VGNVNTANGLYPRSDVKSENDAENMISNGTALYMPERGESGSTNNEQFFLYVKRSKTEKKLSYGAKKKNKTPAAEKANKKCTATQEIALMWPVPWTKKISSPFGNRNGRFHPGVDISSSGIEGKVILAAMDGTITLAGNTGNGYGIHVIIKQGKFSTLYAHCSKLLVKKGEKVSRGQPIGLVGSTGNSSGNHLHFEFSVGGKKIDPMCLSYGQN
jgi:murein DD-endopeptidase MepM/ murein hydrolase activator NlpD